MPQFIYTMKGLGKVHQPDTKVLEDIWLSFYYGAKIGVLGLNGAGKSSLLKIMSGEDQSFIGEAFSGRRHLDRLSQAGAAARRRQDRARQRRGRRRVDQGAARALRRGQREARRGSLSGRDGEGHGRAGEDPGQDRRLQRLGSRLAARDRDGRAAAAAAGRRRHQALGRRAPPRRVVPAAAAVAGPAAARRADQPPRRRVGGLARALPEGLQGHGRRGHPRSLLPRQRRRLDSRARSRPRHSVGRQLLVVARAEVEPPAAGGEGRDAQAADARARARMDPHVAARAPVERQGAPQRLRGAAARGEHQEDRDRRDLHRAGAAARRHRRRGARREEGATATTC